MQHVYRHIHRDPRFHELERKRSVLSWSLATIVLATAFFYIYATAFDQSLFAAPIAPGSAITWGIVHGIADVVLYVIFVGIYIRFANNDFDDLKETIVADALRATEGQQ